MKNKAAVHLGRLSAKKRRKELGHDSLYYRELIKKRWRKEKEKKENSQE